MTRVRIDLRRQTGAGDVPLDGYLRIAPVRRRVASDGGVTYEVLPTGFAAAPQSVIDVTPSVDGDGVCAYAVVEEVPGGRRRWVLVPDSADIVAYSDLAEVDPATLEPSPPALAGWEAVLAQVAEHARVATAAAEDATDAQEARTGAETARDGAVTARTGAETARTEAEALVSAASLDTAVADYLTINPPPAGPPNSLTVGTVTTGAPGTETSADITGTAPDQVLSLTIPRGEPGPAGSAGGVETALYLPGVAGNNVSTPSTAALRPATALDVRVHLKADDVTTGAIIALGEGISNDVSWSLYFSSSTLRVRRSGSGAPATLISASVSGGLTGAWQWVRFTYEFGSPNDTVTFYTSTDGTTWTKLGAARTGATVGAFYATPNPLLLGAAPAIGMGVYLTGSIQRAEIRDGIDGTIVAAWDGRAPAARHRDPQGNIWTVNGTANAWQVIS